MKTGIRTEVDDVLVWDFMPRLNALWRELTRQRPRIRVCLTLVKGMVAAVDRIDPATREEVTHEKDTETANPAGDASSSAPTDKAPLDSRQGE